MCSPEPKHSVRTADFKIPISEHICGENSQTNFVRIAKTWEHMLLFLSQNQEWTVFSGSVRNSHLVKWKIRRMVMPVSDVTGWIITKNAQTELCVKVLCTCEQCSWHLKKLEFVRLCLFIPPSPVCASSLFPTTSKHSA